MDSPSRRAASLVTLWGSSFQDATTMEIPLDLPWCCHRVSVFPPKGTLKVVVLSSNHTALFLYPQFTCRRSEHDSILRYVCIGTISSFRITQAFQDPEVSAFKLHSRNSCCRNWQLLVLSANCILLFHSSHGLWKVILIRQPCQQ